MIFFTSPGRTLFSLAGLCLVVAAGCGHKSTADKIAQQNAAVTLDLDLTVTEIMPDTFWVEHRLPWAANSMVMKVGPHKMLMVDTPYTPEATQKVVMWIRERYGDVQFEAINTGFHVDNLGGNPFLIAQSIPVHGSSQTARLLNSKGEDTRYQILRWLEGDENAQHYQTHKMVSYVAPDHLFRAAEGKVLTFENETVEIFYPGPSHSVDNLVVYARKRKLLFGGCMVKSANATNPGFTGDADLAHWPRAIETILEKYADVQILVPGHGAPGNARALLTHTLDLLKPR